MGISLLARAQTERRSVVHRSERRPRRGPYPHPFGWLATMTRTEIAHPAQRAGSHGQAPAPRGTNYTSKRIAAPCTSPGTRRTGEGQLHSESMRGHVPGPSREGGSTMEVTGVL